LGRELETARENQYGQYYMQLAHAINLRRSDCRANCRNQGVYTNYWSLANGDISTTTLSMCRQLHGFH
jgi:hypothetical protein